MKIFKFLLLLLPVFLLKLTSVSPSYAAWGMCQLPEPPNNTICSNNSNYTYKGDCQIVTCPQGCGLDSPQTCDINDPGARKVNVPCNSVTDTSFKPTECVQVDVIGQRTSGSGSAYKSCNIKGYCSYKYIQCPAQYCTTPEKPP